MNTIYLKKIWFFLYIVLVEWYLQSVLLRMCHRASYIYFMGQLGNLNFSYSVAYMDTYII